MALSNENEKQRRPETDRRNAQDTLHGNLQRLNAEWCLSTRRTKQQRYRERYVFSLESRYRGWVGETKEA